MEHMETSKAVVLIPAYKPDERLIDLTREQQMDVITRTCHTSM